MCVRFQCMGGLASAKVGWAGGSVKSHINNAHTLRASRGNAHAHQHSAGLRLGQLRNALDVRRIKSEIKRIEIGSHIVSVGGARQRQYADVWCKPNTNWAIVRPCGKARVMTWSIERELLQENSFSAAGRKRNQARECAGAVVR